MLNDLRLALLELLHELRHTDITLIIGGGFGLYLRIGLLQEQGTRTLLQEWPEPRSTNDLDLFLRPELLADSARLKHLSAALKRLGYDVVPSARNYQFVRTESVDTRVVSVKIDLLTGPQECFKAMSLKTDGRRVHPQPSVGLHAHPVDEALTLEHGLVYVSLAGQHGSEDGFKGGVCLPHPYTFAMMKLFAFRDRLSDADKEFGRYHALDLYTIIAIITEQEWVGCIKLREAYGEHPKVIEAGQIVSAHFSATDGMGLIRLQESPYYRPTFQIAEFVSALHEVFPHA